jgi:hypothetical protein
MTFFHIPFAALSYHSIPPTEGSKWFFSLYFREKCEKTIINTDLHTSRLKHSPLLHFLAYKKTKKKRSYPGEKYHERVHIILPWKKSRLCPYMDNVYPDIGRMRAALPPSLDLSGENGLSH